MLYGLNTFSLIILILGTLCDVVYECRPMLNSTVELRINQLLYYIILSYLILSYLILSYLISSHLILSYHVIFLKLIYTII